MENIINYAFISYKHIQADGSFANDDYWANILWTKLTKLNIPIKISLENRIKEEDKLIEPIVLDKQAFCPGREVLEIIQENLDSSRVLVVILSKAMVADQIALEETGKTAWIFSEVKYALQKGMPIIQIYIDDDDEEFATLIPYLKDKNLLGDSCRSIFREKRDILDRLMTFSNKRYCEERITSFVASGIFGAYRDYFWNQKKRNFEYLLKKAAFFITLLSTLIAWGIYDYYGMDYEYYADYVDQWGVPTGVVELTKQQVKHKDGHYRFEYTHRLFNCGEGTLERVVYANSYGTAIEHDGLENTDRSSILEIEQRKDGKNGQVIDIEYQNCVQKPLIRACIAGDSMQHVDLKSFVYATKDAAINASITEVGSSIFNNEQQTVKSEIRRYNLTRDENGFIIKKIFQRHNGSDDNPICDAQGIYGFNYELDSIGRPTQIKYLGFEKNNIQNKVGVASKKYIYDKYSNIIECKYLDINDDLVLNEFLWAKHTLIIDDYGNYIKHYFYGINDERCYNGDGIAVILSERNSDGTIAMQQGLDINDKPTLSANGIAIQKMAYDSNGRIIELRDLNYDYQPCLNSDKYSTMKAEYNENGNIINISYYDEKQKPCRYKDGYYSARAEYDFDGNLVKMSYYDVNNYPCFVQYGYSTVKQKYDNEHNLIQTSFFDINNQPCIAFPERYSTCKLVYSKGNVVEYSYFDALGNPCMISDGYSIIRYLYDERGNITKISYYNVDKSPCEIKDGYSVKEYSYDKSGNIVKTEVFDATLQPCLSDGVHKTLLEYDIYGNEIKSYYFDVNNQPCIHKYGASIIKKEYDEYGHNVSASTYGIDSKSCINNNGYSFMYQEYDKKGNLISQRFLDKDKKLSLNNYGWAISRNTYDERNNLIQKLLYDTTGHLIAGENKIAKICYKYDIYGNIIEESYYNSKDKLCLSESLFATSKNEYNFFNQLTKKSLYGVNGELCMGVKGYAIAEMLSDCQDGSIQKMILYDDKGNICNGSLGWAKSKSVYCKYGVETFYYNDKDQIIEIDLSNYWGDPIMNNYGFCSAKKEYDDSGNIIKESYFDTNGNLCLNTEGVAITTKEYNDKGGVITKFFNEKEEKCINVKGVHQICTIYNENKQLIEEHCHNISGDVCKNIDGVVGETCQYNDNGDIEFIISFDKDRQPCMNNDSKYSIAKFEYYENKKIGRITYLDDKSKLCENKMGYAYVTYVYNEMDCNLIDEIVYFNSNKEITNNSEGFSFITIDYVTGIMYFLDKDKKVVKQEAIIDSFFESTYYLY